MATRMQQRRGTAEQWTTVNPTLAEGEIGVETDTNNFKIGNGVDDWSTLGYATSSADLTGYATESYVDDAIESVVGLAPESLDTLAELASVLDNNPNAISDLQAAIDAKQDTLTAGSNIDITGATISVTGLASTDISDFSSAAISATASEYDTLGSAAAAQTAAEGYTDAAIAAIPEVDLAGYATETYVNSAVAGIVDTAPEALDTLNELAAALGDDANFATTIATQIGSKADSEHTHGIDDITDFDITSPADSSFLKYNSSTSKWEDAIIIDGGNA